MSRRGQGIEVKGHARTDTVLGGGLMEDVGLKAPTWLHTHWQQQTWTHTATEHKNSWKKEELVGLQSSLYNF